MKRLMSNINSSSFLTAVTTSVAVLTLTACASKPTVNSANLRAPAPQYYTVKAGDTLSKIASRYGLDYREIARLNNIDNNYIIYTNQSLRLRKANANEPKMQVKTIAAPAWENIRTQSLPISEPIQSKPVTTAPSSYPNPVTSAPNIVNKAPPITNTVPNTPTPIQYSVAWRWPADGQVIQQFDPAKDIKGVRISGKQGDPVRAAADGEVVYASDRLTEYGNLVLIRHFSNGYVTAYAHNSRMLVTENQRVKAGQQIAEMGSTGTTQVMLEFQIRLNGKPINPLSLLPQR